MSSYYVERFLEDKYEEGLEEGMSKEQAEKYAFKCLEEKANEQILNRNNRSRYNELYVWRRRE